VSCSDSSQAPGGLRVAGQCAAKGVGPVGPRIARRGLACTVAGQVLSMSRSCVGVRRSRVGVQLVANRINASPTLRPALALQVVLGVSRLGRVASPWTLPRRSCSVISLVTAGWPLGLSVGQPRRLRARLPVDVLDADPAHQSSSTTPDDPSVILGAVKLVSAKWPRWLVADLALEAVRRSARTALPLFLRCWIPHRRRPDACRRRRANRRQVMQVELADLHVCRSCPGGASSPCGLPLPG